jgi:hypothetical protein
VIALIITIAVITSPPTSTTSTSSWSSSPGGNGGPYSVNVNEVVVVAPATACGLNGTTYGSFSVPAYSRYSIDWSLPLGGASFPCSVSGVSTDTPGFSVTANLPLNVTSTETMLFLEVDTPAYFDGALTLTFT